MSLGSNRAPRPDEIRLLELLASSPRMLITGPVGRCTKRGWCRRRPGDRSDFRSASWVYELTDAGWSELSRQRTDMGSNGDLGRPQAVNLTTDWRHSACAS
jgi:hypothetical protein